MRQCIICSNDFNPTNGYQKCCSPDCSRTNELEFARRYNYTNNGINSYRKYHSSEGFKIVRNKYQREYRKTPLGRFHDLKKKAKRRAIKNHYIESFTFDEWNNKLKSSKGLCHGINGKCLSKNPNVGINKLTRDHIFPVSKASIDYLLTGKKRIYTINDVQPLCASCNKSKRDKII